MKNSENLFLALVAQVITLIAILTYTRQFWTYFKQKHMKTDDGINDLKQVETSERT